MGAASGDRKFLKEGTARGSRTILFHLKQQPVLSFIVDSSFSILKTNCLSRERDRLTKFLDLACFLPGAEPAVVGVDVRVAARTVCAVELRLRGRGLLHSLVREWVIRVN